MNLAKGLGMARDNPCEDVPKFREEKRERWLFIQEINASAMRSITIEPIHRKRDRRCC